MSIFKFSTERTNKLEHFTSVFGINHLKPGMAFFHPLRVFFFTKLLLSRLCVTSLLDRALHLLHQTESPLLSAQEYNC